MDKGAVCTCWKKLVHFFFFFGEQLAITDPIQMEPFFDTKP